MWRVEDVVECPYIMTNIIRKGIRRGSLFLSQFGNLHIQKKHICSESKFLHWYQSKVVCSGLKKRVLFWCPIDCYRNSFFFHQRRRQFFLYSSSPCFGLCVLAYILLFSLLWYFVPRVKKKKRRCGLLFVSSLQLGMTIQAAAFLMSHDLCFLSPHNCILFTLDYMSSFLYFKSHFSLVLKKNYMCSF